MNAVSKKKISVRQFAAVLVISLVGTFLVGTFTVSSVSAATSSELSKFGDNGSSVERLQKAITARGFTIRGGVTGIFDDNTRLALKSLQKVAGFKATGALDDRTAKFLGLVDVAPISESNLPSVGMSGDSVWSLQQALINNGSAVKGGADGKFGLATTIALGRFQSAKGLPVTKTLDKNTAVALGLVAAPAPAQVAVAKATNPVVAVVAVAVVATPVGASVGAPVGASVASTMLTIETLPVRGHTSEAVRQVQNALIANGIEVKGGADAIFGVATTIALGKFQEAKGIAVSKTLDIQTAIALGVLPSVESMGLTKIAVFPVQGPCGFTDTWHAPRPGGREHLGVDVIAARGQAIYSVVDGAISQMTTGGALSGNGLRVAQSDGTYFFYAHLDSFAPGITVGSPVRAGQVIGYVGNTGTTSTHLHFEVHPFGGDAVSPYAVIKAVDACNVTTLLPQS